MLHNRAMLTTEKIVFLQKEGQLSCVAKQAISGDPQTI